MFTLFAMELAINHIYIKRKIKRYLLLIGVDADLGHGILIEDLNQRLKELNPLWIQKLNNKNENEKATKFYIDGIMNSCPSHSIVPLFVDYEDQLFLLG